MPGKRLAIAAMTAATVTLWSASPANASDGGSCDVMRAGPGDASPAAPYSLATFRAVIDNSRSLQVQSTSTCLTRARMQGLEYVAEHWRLDAGAMLFAFDNWLRGERVELRGESFAADESRRFEASVQVAVDGQSPSFTIAQIFGEDTSDPILRVAMLANRRGVRNHLWGIYRTGTGDAPVEYQDLGPAPTTAPETLLLQYNREGAITAQLGAHPSQSWTTSLAFWTASGKSTYFKAGCYVQSDGGCRVRYTSLSF